MDKSAGDLNITNVNINELLEQILKRLKPIAEKQNIELMKSLDEENENWMMLSEELEEIKKS